MSALDKFMRESRDIVAGFIEHHRLDPTAAVVELRQKLAGLRIEVRRLVIHQVKKTYPEIVNDPGI